jgi:hypothetical protein
MKTPPTNESYENNIFIEMIFLPVSKHYTPLTSIVSTPQRKQKMK